jgi:hypothetical protein
VVHALRGTRNLDEADERIEDDELAGVLRRQAGRVWVLASAAAVVLTAIALLLPG